MNKGGTMKRIIITVLLLLSAFCLVCCGSGGTGEEAGTTPASPAATETQKGETTPGETPDNGPLSFTLDGEVLNVSLSLEEKSAEASVLLLPDREAVESWREDASVVIDIDQVKTDENGRAEVRLTLPEDQPKALLVVTVGESVYEREVR